MCQTASLFLSLPHNSIILMLMVDCGEGGHKKMNACTHTQPPKCKMKAQLEYIQYTMHAHILRVLLLVGHTDTARTDRPQLWYANSTKDCPAIQ